MTTSLARIVLSVTIAACAPTAGGNMTGGKELGMMYCPSAVKGAVTEVERTAGGVDLTITAPDASTRREIVTLAQVQSVMSEPDLDRPLHSGQHGGPGTVGHCPVIHVGTKVTHEQIPEGVRIHVVATSSDDVPRVQQMSSERATALHDRAKRPTPP